MTRTHCIATALLLVVVVGCEAEPAGAVQAGKTIEVATPDAPDATPPKQERRMKEETKATSLDTKAPPSADRVRAILAADGQDAAEQIDWPTVLHANALWALAAGLDIELPDGGDPVESVARTLAKLDIAEEAEGAKRDFLTSWQPRAGCAVEPSSESKLAGLTPKVLGRLPPEVQIAARTIDEGKRFVAHCNTTSHALTLNAEGRVVAMELLSGGGALPTNRFTDHMARDSGG